MLSGWELVVVLVIVLLLFGAKRLPDLAGSLGTSIKEFRKATNEPEELDAGSGDAGSPTDTPTS